MSSARNLSLGAPPPECLAFPLDQVYPWKSCKFLFCMLMSRKFARSLTLRIEEARVSILEEMSSRMDRIEQKLLRFNTMRRVLLRVDDLGLAVAESTDQMRESISSLEDRLVSLISPVLNDHALNNGANALDLASNVGPRFTAAGKPMIRTMVSMVNMVIHRLLIWTTTQSMEIARRKLRTML
jgi:hypothetical protein